MAEEEKAASEGSEVSVEVEETVEVVEETVVEEEESEASTSKKKKKKSKKKKPAKKKKQPAGSPPPKKRKKKKAKTGSIVWAYPRKPAIAPSYSPCPHIYFKHSVVDRSKLNQQKYTELLATPKSEPWKEPEEELQKFRRRPLTPRTECLALPTKRKMQAQLVEFQNILTPQMVENLGILLGTNCDLTADSVKALTRPPMAVRGRGGPCFPGLDDSLQWLGARITAHLADLIASPPGGPKSETTDAIASNMAKRLKQVIGTTADPKQNKKIDTIIKNLAQSIASLAVNSKPTTSASKTKKAQKSKA